MKLISLTFLFYIVIITNGLGLSPTQEYKNTPEKYGMTYELIDISSKHNASIHAWYFPSTYAEHLIIVSHNGVGNMGDYLERVKRLQKYGFSVLAYDYRGFGASSAFNIDPTNYIYAEFYDDHESVVDYCNKNFDAKLISYGWGIGAGIAICKGYNNTKITGIIADNAFTNIYELVNIFVTKKLAMELPSKILKDKNSPIHTISQASTPSLLGMLLFHSPNNYIISEIDQIRLLEASRLYNKELYQFKSSAAMDTFKGNESEYIRQMYLFAMNL